jgi:hypothetical protein
MGAAIALASITVSKSGFALMMNASHMVLIATSMLPHVAREGGTHNARPTLSNWRSGLRIDDLQLLDDREGSRLKAPAVAAVASKLRRVGDTDIADMVILLRGDASLAVGEWVHRRR